MTRYGGHSWRRALLVGVVIVAGPIVGLNALLALNIVTTAQEEVDGLAAETLALAEARLDAAATSLISLGLNDVRECSANDLDAMRVAGQRAQFVSEIAVVDAAGAGQCAAFGDPRVVRRISPEHGTLSPDVQMSLVGVGESTSLQLIRLQWRYQDGVGLRVLMPGESLFPFFLKSRLTAGFAARAVTIDGAVIARKLVDPSLEDDAPSALPTVEAAAASQRYPIRVEISTPGSALAAANASLFLYANVSGLALALIALSIAVLVSRRSGGPVREIADAIRNGQFTPYYQPVIDIMSGRLAGCEVLVRWTKPDGSVLPPGRFITLAEASGQIFPMTIALMEAARDDLGPLYAERPNLKLGFNLFAGHFDDVSIVEDVERIFAASSIRMTQLMFEVTERQPLPNIPGARLVIAKLQALGARVALDDVGTGHGGLSYLLKLGVDVMKMDKMFVDAIGTDRYSVAIVDSLVKLAEDMNLDLIAEGVETIEQVEYLRGKGVRMAQGYVFAPPLPASSFRALVEAMVPARKGEGRDQRAGGRYVGPLRHASA
ncbi:EAL domain-containing protein [Hansschlegelia zhihuaiae]|uniref:EAL domain-containing protein n=1 Tax=Hansschlegelia zhihuaiae TaxID=405005 RepID=A0A4Q0MK46_9HYPH|nr:EAL domain-containing protein [Hansschlegelia zhihuaiae]RXF73948.1 EAL domain-containing protein [Hansschlegelia zhihuaiae]